MANFAYVDEGLVIEVIPSENPDLPGFTLAQRYSAEFLNKLIEIPEDVPVGQSWRYDATTGTFLEPLLPTMRKVEE